MRIIAIGDGEQSTKCSSRRRHTDIRTDRNLMEGQESM